MDELILSLIKDNLLTITLLLMLIQGIAKITPWPIDDKIGDLFSDIFNFVRGGKDREK